MRQSRGERNAEWIESKERKRIRRWLKEAVELRIGQKRMSLDEERRGGSARLKGSQVVIE